MTTRQLSLLIPPVTLVATDTGHRYRLVGIHRPEQHLWLLPLGNKRLTALWYLPFKFGENLKVAK